MKGGLSKEVVSDEGEINMGHIHFCDQQSGSYKWWSFTKVVSERGYHCTSICTYMYVCVSAYIHIYSLTLSRGGQIPSKENDHPPTPPH